MKKRWTILGVVIVGLILVLAIGTWAMAQEPGDSQPAGAETASTQRTPLLSGNDSQPVGPAEVFIPERYRPRESSRGMLANGPGATVYFTPQDENTSTTVFFLYNTSDVTATVGLQTFELDGSLYIDTSIQVPPYSLVRICGDDVSSVSWTWQDVVLVNFTTASTYAKMTLPSGVKAEGYVVWNDGLTYDPLQVAPTLSLRFSTDPATVFLPLAQRN